MWLSHMLSWYQHCVTNVQFCITCTHVCCLFQLSIAFANARHVAVVPLIAGESEPYCIDLGKAATGKEDTCCKMRCGWSCTVSHHKAVVHCCLISTLVWKTFEGTSNKLECLVVSCKVWWSIYRRSVCDTELLVFPLQWHNRVLINNLTLGN